MAQMINGVAVIPTTEKKIPFIGSKSCVYHISGAEQGDSLKRGKREGSLTMLPALPQVNLHFTDLSYSVPDRRRGTKRILSGLSGTFFSQKVTAIMGPSGAGKSTLLNVLAGYKTKGLTGSVMMNGVDRKLLSSYRRLLSYIMQEDHLMPHLTVYEAMTIASHLKLGDQFSTKGKSIIVDEILETLGLADCKETKSVNLSGGQRKRLSIALELINNPPIIFFDEPTSGLDSSSCFQCLTLLRSLARGGRTIVCSIHQPSARLFEMFDHLYVLAEGQCIYQGRVPGLVPFLGSLGLDCPSYHNPADYVIEIASGEHGDVVPRLVNAVKNGKCETYVGNDDTTEAYGSSNNDLTQLRSNNELVWNVIGDLVKNHKILEEKLDRVLSILEAPTNNVRNGVEPGCSIEEDILPRLPIKVEDMEFLENKIKDPSIKQKLMKYLMAVGGKDAKGLAANVMRRMFMDEVGERYSLTGKAGKDVPGKKPFKNTQSFKLIYESFNGAAKPTENNLNETFSSSAFPISHFRQFWILWKRTLVCTARDMSLFWVRLTSHILCGLLIGAIYYEIGDEASKVVSNSSCIFITTLFLMFTAMMPTITTFPMEKKVFIKEHMNHWYSLTSFYFAKTIADIPFQILFSSLYVTIVYFLSSQPNEMFRFLMVLGVCFLVSLVAQSLGLFIGALLTVEKGVYIGPVLNVPTLLFSGFFVSLSSLPASLGWVADVSYIRYGFEGAMQAVYGFNRSNLHCSEPYCHFKSPDKFLREMDMGDADFLLDCAALVMFFLILRILCYLVLQWNLYRRS